MKNARDTELVSRGGRNGKKLFLFIPSSVRLLTLQFFQGVEELQGYDLSLLTGKT